MEQVVDLALPEYFERISAEATFQEQLSVIDMDNSRRSPVQVKNYPIRLKGYSLIFVLSGEITIGINYLSHTLKKNTVMQVYPDDIIEHTAYSADFKGYLIIHSAEKGNNGYDIRHPSATGGSVEEITYQARVE